ncbi:unnamed protein product [Danaus chrysippus]|uniref:(African queen) hypothetical protein n=1 Tax=Danaus chrysippus TaxID=151541 RepID=A0A8J2MWW2_9NEOP|nr:unnamed protein product [Danaus chrysippus]
MKNMKSDSSAKLTRWSFCITKFTEFCKRTDLHGFKYIVMEDLSVVERCVWAGAVVISILCAAFFVTTAYSWYARNPIATVIESTQGAIWDVPFPAVTICDLNMISRRAARDLSNVLTLPENVTADFVFKTLKVAPLLHSSNMADPIHKRDLHILQDVLDLNNITVETLFKKLSPASSCRDLLERCMWKNTIYHCDQIFQHVFNTILLCCTFNYYALDQPSDEQMIFRHSTPRRVASCGYQTALTAILKTDPSDYYSTSVASLGTLVFIDNPYNVPDFDSPVRMVNPSTEMMIAVSPEQTYATEGTKSFTPDERQCYYSDEVKIPYIHKYSYHNCMMLRKIQILINVCNCVPFFFPHDGDSRICNFHDVECLENVKSPYRVNNGSEEEDPRTLNLIKCLPECEHFDYPLEVALGKLFVNVPLGVTSFYEGINLENRSVLNVFFNDLVSTKYRREVYLNWQNILAAFGGLLSLMLGFTLIAGFDFILFFTLRVAYDFLIKCFKNESKPTNSHIINVEEYKKERWINNTRRKKIYSEHGKMFARANESNRY